jgi:hypothetical protein
LRALHACTGALAGFHVPLAPYKEQIPMLFAMENKTLVAMRREAAILGVAHWHHRREKTQKTAKNSVTSSDPKGV